MKDDGTALYSGTEATRKIEELAIDLDQLLDHVIYLNISAVVSDVKTSTKTLKEVWPTCLELRECTG